MSQTIAIGGQDFEYLRTNQYFFIDKSDFIREWWENGDTATLITRPRRFGKTLNLHMLECFFSNRYAGRSDLFEGLSIWKKDAYRQLQGSYPVIFLSFASLKCQTYESAMEAFNYLNPPSKASGIAAVTISRYRMQKTKHRLQKPSRLHTGR